MSQSVSQSAGTEDNLLTSGLGRQTRQQSGVNNVVKVAVFPDPPGKRHNHTKGCNNNHNNHHNSLVGGALARPGGSRESVWCRWKGAVGLDGYPSGITETINGCYKSLFADDTGIL